MSDEQADDMTDPLREVANAMPHAPVATAPGIAAIALSMAMKFHDINTVQDGILYQQYKLEGKNLHGLHLDDVFETAMRIELHLLGASVRLAEIVVDAVMAGAADADTKTDEEAS